MEGYPALHALFVEVKIAQSSVLFGVFALIRWPYSLMLYFFQQFRIQPESYPEESGGILFDAKRVPPEPSSEKP